MKRKIFSKDLCVIFHKDSIEYRAYPFAPASVCTDPEVSATEIVEVGLGATPPELRLSTQEILFVPALQKDPLQQFAQLHKIPVIKRVDVWSLLLEPYLDTEFTSAQQQRTMEELKTNGFEAEEVDQIRSTLGPKVLFYNTFAWEWVHLGLFDLLTVHSNSKIYKRAMEIANRG